MKKHVFKQYVISEKILGWFDSAYVLLTDEMLAADVNRTRTGAQTENNRWTDLKSTQTHLKQDFISVGFNTQAVKRSAVGNTHARHGGWLQCGQHGFDLLTLGVLALDFHHIQLVFGGRINARLCGGRILLPGPSLTRHYD